jgi:MioC protein
MKIAFLFGTESGNSEMVAEDLRDSVAQTHETEVHDLGELSIDDLNTEDFFVVVCSSYGEGELPSSAVPFYEQLVEVQPDLTGVRYAMFGLGDTFYEDTYSQGSEVLDRELTKLGAERVGEYGRHDASTWEAPSEVASEWLPTVLEQVSVLALAHN